MVSFLARMLSSLSAPAVEPFGLGAAKEEVLLKAGPPKLIDGSGRQEVWHYETTYKNIHGFQWPCAHQVRFEGNSVVGFMNDAGRLPIKVKSNPAFPDNVLRIGADKDAVLNALGTPSSMSGCVGDRWVYVKKDNPSHRLAIKFAADGFVCSVEMDGYFVNMSGPGIRVRMS